jgi:hypothetical protein
MQLCRGVGERGSLSEQSIKGRAGMRQATCRS